MITAILAIAVVICGLGWLCYWLSSTALVMYIIGKDYTPPTERELKACMKEVLLRTLKIKR